MNSSLFRIIILSAILTLSSCCTKPYIVTLETAATNDKPQTAIFVASHGWHTGFVIPADEMDKKVPFFKKRFGNASYYEFGWGDEGFYQVEKITSGLAVKAIFWPTDTVIHVVAVTGEPEAYFPYSDIIKIPAKNNELESLEQFIIQSFAKDADGNFYSLGSGIYGKSQFYRAEGKYYLANTCNKWTAKGLKSMGENISVEFKLTAGSIMDYLEKAGFPKINSGL